MKLQCFFDTTDEISVAIENSGDDGEIAIVTPVGFLEMELLQVDMRENCEFGISIAGLEELRVQVDWQFVNFFLRKDGIFNLLLGCLLGSGRLLWCKVAAPCLNGEVFFLWRFHTYFQPVKMAIQ